jgi:hypothetical protein
MTVGDLKFILEYFDNSADVKIIEDEFGGRDGELIEVAPSHVGGGDVQLKVHFYKDR